MLVNCFFFLISFFLLKTNSQVHPEHFTYFTMDQGVQTKHKIEGHQIVIHQFNSFIVKNLFYFQSIERAPLIYGYYCDDVQNFNIKEAEIPQYISFSLLLLPTIIESYSNLLLHLLFQNDIGKQNQYIIIVYCPNDVPCEYSILFEGAGMIQIFQNTPIAKATYKEAMTEIKIKIEEGETSVNFTVTVYLISYSGMIDFPKVTY